MEDVETNKENLGAKVTTEAVQNWLDQLHDDIDDAEQSFEREALGGDRSLQQAMEC